MADRDPHGRCVCGHPIYEHDHEWKCRECVCSKWTARGLAIELDRLVQTCGACPSQWDAWGKDGWYYYIRYRSGVLTVNRGGVAGPEVFRWERIGDRLDGSIEWERVSELTGMVLDT